MKIVQIKSKFVPTINEWQKPDGYYTAHVNGGGKVIGTLEMDDDFEIVQQDLGGGVTVDMIKHPRLIGLTASGDEAHIRPIAQAMRGQLYDVDGQLMTGYKYIPV